jgi:hypothetical protein
MKVSINFYYYTHIVCIFVFKDKNIRLNFNKKNNLEACFKKYKQKLSLNKVFRHSFYSKNIFLFFNGLNFFYQK